MDAETRHPELREIVTTEVEIEAIVGKPAPRIVTKVTSALDDNCLGYIARSPFVIIASSDATGRVDVSPRGDPRASCTCWIVGPSQSPTALGNCRADTFRNVLRDPDRARLGSWMPSPGQTLCCVNFYPGI